MVREPVVPASVVVRDTVDQRRARGERTRAAVAAALVDLLEEGVADPTARQVAERAGVSPRLVFHHYADMEDLYLAVSVVQYERHWRRRPTVPADLPLPQRIRRLVEVRGAVFDDVAAVRRAALRRAGRSPQLQSRLDATNALLRDEVATLFADVLGTLPRERAAATLDALDAATSFENWDRMRRAQHLSRPAARRAIVMVLTALLADPGSAGP